MNAPERPQSKRLVGEEMKEFSNLLKRKSIFIGFGLVILLISNAFANIPQLNWPLSGEIDDRVVTLAFGENWIWGECPVGVDKQHTGIDVSAVVGEYVFAPEDGTVMAKVYDPSWEYAITIQHDGYTTVCWHVDPSVEVGWQVTRNQVIGTIADLGSNTHFHFGVRDANYNNTSNAGALPTTDCGGYPAFPEFFVDPESLEYGPSTDPLFGGRIDYDVGTQPSSVFSADLDGDSDNDLAVANYGSNNISILLNYGDGTFAPAVNYEAGERPISVYSADLDGDSDNDLAVANWNYSPAVSILLNNGDGTFASAVHYEAGYYPTSVYSADLDGDSDNDLAVANCYSYHVSILLNNGDGTFASAVNFGVNDEPWSVYSTDLDGDSDKDLAVANLDSDNVSILLNHGDGTFASAVNYGASDGPISVFSADLSGDNYNDLMVANKYSYNVSILLNNGDGTFQSRINYGVGNNPHSVYSVDLDGDSDSDLAVACGGGISILLNNGDGTFNSPVNYETGVGSRSVYCADLDGDSDNDLAVANTVSNNVSILFNQGTGEQEVKPLVLIPGIMGTHLYERYDQMAPVRFQEVWFNIDYANYKEEHFFNKLKMEEDGHTPENQNICLNDPGKLMGEEFMDWGSKNVYGYLINAIEGLNGGETYKRNEKFFTFPYDWRYDNANTCNEFNHFIEEKIPSGQFDVIAHSMGGLIAKQWAKDNPGRIRNCFFIGPPHNGATEAFRNLHYGRPFGPLPLFLELSSGKIKELSRNMIPVYQLLPNSTYLTKVPGGIYCTQILNAEPECYEDISEFLPNQNFFTQIEESQLLMESPIVNIDNPYIIGSIGHQTITRIIDKFLWIGRMTDYDYEQGDGTVPWFSTYFGQEVPYENRMFFVGRDNNTKHSALCNYPGTISYIFDKLGFTYIPPPLMMAQEPTTEFKPVSYISGTIGGPIELDMYDNNGNHSGLNESMLPEFNIPGTNISCYENSQAFYYTNVDDITLEITGTGDGSLLCYIAAHIDSLTSVTKLYEATHFGLPVTKGSIFKITTGFDRTSSNILCDYDGNQIFEDTISMNYIFYKNDFKSAKQKKRFTIRNTPNPFNSKTAIEFELAEDTKVEITVYNVLGQRVETLVDDYLNAGQHSVAWDASNYSSGIYFYKLTTDGKTFTKRMTLLK